MNAIPSASLPENTYIPGFDWARLFGSTIVVMTHCGLLDPILYAVGDAGFSLLNCVVPVFFLMAGYLIAGKLDNRAYVIGYVKKYALLYLGVSLLRFLLHIGHGLFVTGAFSLRDVLTFVALLPFKNVYIGALWFVPALIYGVIVSALLRGRPTAMRIVCLLCAVVIAVHAVTGHANSQYPARCIAKGILFVHLGVVRREKKLPLLPVAAAAIAMAIFELTVVWLDLASIAISLPVFEGVLRLKGDFLRPWHRQISIFSLLNYFLHRLEKTLLDYFTDLGGAGVLLVILAVNALMTVGICIFLQRTQQRTPADAP